MPALPYDPVAASLAVADADPRLAEIVARVGPPTFTLRDEPLAAALVRSIVGQQLSTQAAATIHGRVLDAFGEDGALSFRALADAPDAALRACGLSRAKTAAVQDLVTRHLDGTLPSPDALADMTDAEAVDALTVIRGVGPWTAQMVLLFTLGRPDVWPTADLGVQEGYRLVAELGARPTPAELAAAGEVYRPWRSVAAWYLWRAVALARQGNDG